MARKKKPEDQSQAGPINAHGRRMPATKTEAVKMAIAAGFDGPQIGSGYILSQFGLEVSPQHFSSTKSQLKSKMLETGPVKRRELKAAVEGYLAPPPKQAPAGEDAGQIEALEAMKPLVAIHGAERIKRMVDLLG